MVKLKIAWVEIFSWKSWQLQQETVPGVTVVLAPEGATVSLLQCQRGASTQKNSSSWTHHKGFAEQEQTGYEGSLSCIRWWACNRAAFPTISDSNRVHCAIVLKQSRLFDKEHKQSSAARRERAWVHPDVCEQRKRAVYTQKTCSGSEAHLRKEPTEEPTKR